MPSTIAVVGAFCVAAAGILLSIQAGMNATLGAISGRSFASLVSFATGTIAIVVFFTVDTYGLKNSGPSSESIKSVPWWGWFGGVLGAYYVSCNIIFVRILGSAILTAIFVSGQLITAVVLDSMGWVGFKKRDLHWARLLGIFLMIAGVILISVFNGDTTSSPEPPPPLLPDSDSLPPAPGSQDVGDTASQGLVTPRPSTRSLMDIAVAAAAKLENQDNGSASDVVRGEVQLVVADVSGSSAATAPGFTSQQRVAAISKEQEQQQHHHRQHQHQQYQ
mmetsp:Transcript_37773/g.84232  ORF Transcript_37773/g.84232 Transcript_37773/m.84232 type:complete len:277 (+) Transcript_37773:97-927(+)